MFVDYIKIATSNLLKRRLRSWLTMIGIFIGIAAVISLIGLGEGLRNAISSQFSNMGTDIIAIQASGVQYGPPGSGAVNPLTLDLEEKIERIDGVDMAISRIIESCVVEYNNRIMITILGTMPDGLERKEIERIGGFSLDKGRFLKDGDRNKVVLGSGFTKEDDFGKAVKVGDNILINDKKFEVVGLLKKSGNFFLEKVILMNEEPARELLDMPEKVSILAVKVKKGENIEIVTKRIEKIMRKERGVKEGEEDFSVELAADAIETVKSTLFAVQLFVYIIASISLLVGGIGIMNTMYTSVVERTKEIGIMKSIGARNIDIFTIFFIESGFLGMVGGLIGILLGTGIAKGTAFIGAMQLGSDLIQAHITPMLIIGGLLFSFILGSIAGITPAIKASKLHPVDALRYSK